MGMKINMPSGSEPDHDEDSHPSQNRFDYLFHFENRRRIWRPPTDFFETDDAFQVHVEAGGMNDEDFSITFVKQSLFISAVRSAAGDKRTYHQMEITCGELGVHVRIPSPVTKEDIDASYHNGILVVVLPKAPEPTET